MNYFKLEFFFHPRILEGNSKIPSCASYFRDEIGQISPVVNHWDVLCSLLKKEDKWFYHQLQTRSGSPRLYGGSEWYRGFDICFLVYGPRSNAWDWCNKGRQQGFRYRQKIHLTKIQEGTKFLYDIISPISLRVNVLALKRKKNCLEVWLDCARACNLKIRTTRRKVSLHHKKGVRGNGSWQVSMWFVVILQYILSTPVNKSSVGTEGRNRCSLAKMKQRN